MKKMNCEAQKVLFDVKREMRKRVSKMKKNNRKKMREYIN